jgi:hypothetical protein
MYRTLKNIKFFCLFLVKRMESELENYNSPTIFEETLGPCECPPFLQVCRDFKTL